MSKVICFGESLMRFSPPGFKRIVQTRSLDIEYGGAESNVAISLSNLGEDVSYITKLPDNAFGDACINELRRYGVNTSNILRGGERMGIYFLEKGSSVRSSKVIYDRKYSSFSTLVPGEIDWVKTFEGAKWFHFTGITAALGQNLVDVLEEACKNAKMMGLTISCDINYRKNLWSLDKASKVMEKLLKYADLVVSGEDEAESMFGIKGRGEKINGHWSDDGYSSIAEEIVSRFGCSKAALALRDNLPTLDNVMYGYFYDGNDFSKSKEYTIRIIDQLGAGDIYTAGIIYGILNNLSSKDTVEFAAASSALKHTIEGDFNIVSLDEVKSLMNATSISVTQR